MASARHLLHETRLSVKQIAADIGYDDPLYFPGQFTKHFGVSPKHVRDEDMAGDKAMNR